VPSTANSQSCYDWRPPVLQWQIKTHLRQFTLVKPHVWLDLSASDKRCRSSQQISIISFWSILHMYLFLPPDQPCLSGRVHRTHDRRLHHLRHLWRHPQDGGERRLHQQAGQEGRHHWQEVLSLSPKSLDHWNTTIQCASIARVKLAECYNRPLSLRERLKIVCFGWAGVSRKWNFLLFSFRFTHSYVCDIMSEGRLL